MKTNPARISLPARLSATILFGSLALHPALAQNINPATGLPASPATGMAPPPALNPATGRPLMPGEQPADSPILVAGQTGIDVRSLIRKGQYAEALQRCLAFHNQYRASFTLSMLLSDWVELSRRFPPARDALIDIRDRDVQEFSTGRRYADLFAEINAINHALHQDPATYDLFLTFRDKDPDLAQQCYFYVQDLLMDRGDYDWCYRHLGNPQERFENIHQSFATQLANQQRMNALHAASQRRMEELNRQHGWTNHLAFSQPDLSARLKTAAEDNFVGDTRKLVEILVATGHPADAEQIVDQALTVLDDERLKTAIADATQSIREHQKK